MAYLYVCIAQLCDLRDFSSSDAWWLQTQHVTQVTLQLRYALARHG